jgi:O-antigen/teichoic acid export membrane protein
MMKTHWRLAKNAVANLVRGGTAGVVALILPAVLVRHMTQTNYAVWVLVLQVAAYSAYLEFGLQTAVGRYIAIAHEKEDYEQGNSIFSTAVVGLSVAAAIAIVMLCVVTIEARWIFPAVPAALLTEMQRALLIVGVSIAIGLPSSALSGVFIGMQRNELIAVVTAVSKLLSAFGLVFAAIHGASLVHMAEVVAIVNVISYLVQYLLLKKFSSVVYSTGLVRRSTAKELFGYCFSLMIWSFSMILVSGLDLILVGRFQLSALAPYALATTLATFVAGLQNAIFGATMPHAAVLHARGDSAGLGDLVVNATRFGVLLLILTGMPLLIYASPILRIWVGQQYAVQGHLLLTVLLVANMIRLSGTPYSVVLVASAQQRLVILSPLMEGVSNLIASVVLGMRFGAAGVAAGTLLGAIVGMLGHIFYNMPRTRQEIRLRSMTFFSSSICLPLLATAPLIVLAVHYRDGRTPGDLISASSFAITLLFSAGLLLYTRTRKVS